MKKGSIGSTGERFRSIFHFGFRDNKE